MKNIKNLLTETNVLTCSKCGIIRLYTEELPIACPHCGSCNSLSNAKTEDIETAFDENISANTLLLCLEDNPTFNELISIDGLECFNYREAEESLDVLGYVYVRVAEGILEIPYEEAELLEGEHLLLEKARFVSKNDYDIVLSKAERRLEFARMSFTSW